MDILQRGAEVEVLAPDPLRRRVRQQLEGALEQYREK